MSVANVFRSKKNFRLFASYATHSPSASPELASNVRLRRAASTDGSSMSRSNLGAQAGAQVRLALAHAQLMLQRLDGETAHLPWLSVIQARTGVPRVYAFLILAASA